VCTSQSGHDIFHINEVPFYLGVAFGVEDVEVPQLVHTVLGGEYK
jgi:hypothetical protein